MATVHNEPPLDLQLLKAARQRKFLARRVHERTFHCRFGAVAGTSQHRHPLARRREDARGLGAARKEPHWIIRWYGTEVQLDRVRQLRHKRVDDKQQTQGRALRGWSKRVTIHRRTASRILKLLLIVPIVNDVFEDMYISFWYAYEEIAQISVGRITK